MKLEATHSSDIAACLPDYKELCLGETVTAVGSMRISPLTRPSSVLLFYFILFYFILFYFALFLFYLFFIFIL